MSAGFLLYGANGFVGEVTARLAAQRGLRPILAGRNAVQVQRLAAELGLPCRVFGLDDSAALDQALAEVVVVLHCAGPYVHTYKPMVEGCLRTGTHYLDITGEILVYEALASHDAEATARKVMLLPGVGFDVVPTDCLALHLKQRLTAATRLALAWSNQGPTGGGFPPGTVNMMLEMTRRGMGMEHTVARRNGQLQSVPPGYSRMVDFVDGPTKVTRLTWGDVYTAFHSTGIPNIEDFAALPDQFFQFFQVLGTLHLLLRVAAVRNLAKRMIPTGTTAEQRAETRTAVWGETQDDQGHKAVSHLHGPEAGVMWTALAALAVVQKVLAGQAPVGFQTPALAYGAYLVLECEGVSRQDVN